MKARDYKTADAPKAEPLKVSLGEKLRSAQYERLTREIGEVNEKLAEANELCEAAERLKKEQTP